MQADQDTNVNKKKSAFKTGEKRGEKTEKSSGKAVERVPVKNLLPGSPITIDVKFKLKSCSLKAIGPSRHNANPD